MIPPAKKSRASTIFEWSTSGKLEHLNYVELSGLDNSRFQQATQADNSWCTDLGMAIQTMKTSVISYAVEHSGPAIKDVWTYSDVERGQTFWTSEIEKMKTYLFALF